MNSATGQPMGAQTGDSGDHGTTGTQGDKGGGNNVATATFNKENIAIL